MNEWDKHTRDMQIFVAGLAVGFLFVAVGLVVYSLITR
jgi:hypothetical protein